MDLATEFKIKIQKLTKAVADSGMSGIALNRTDHFAWATCGGRSHVNIAQDAGVATFVLSGDKPVVVTNKIERLRLEEQELCGLPVELVELPWTADRLRYISENIFHGNNFISDITYGKTLPASPIMDPLIYELTESEIARFRTLGAMAGDALEATCRSIRSGVSEGWIAGNLSHACQEMGMDPIVTLIACDEKILKYRHPLFDAKMCFNKTAMVVLCARMNGLIASCTRMVSAGEPSQELKDRHRACVEVDVAMNTATIPGAKISDVFKICKETYALHGFAGEELLHHQGGPCGYRTRYFTANDDSSWDVLPETAFAWNPSITGTKSEDTIITGVGGVEYITARPSWPMINVEISGGIISRPDILVI